MGTSFVGGVSQPSFCRQRGEIRRGQEGPPRLAPASWAFAGLFAFHHRPHVGERSATLTEIVVDGHRSLPTDRIASGERQGNQSRTVAEPSITRPATSAYR